MQGTLTAALPASIDVTTRNWLLSGMTVQLFQVHTSPVTPAGSTAGLDACEGRTTVSEQCIARGVLQPDTLLDGLTREWSCRLSLLKEVPLFDAKGVRLGVQSGATGDADEVCTVTATSPWHMESSASLASLSVTSPSSLTIFPVSSHTTLTFANRECFLLLLGMPRY